LSLAKIYKRAKKTPPYSGVLMKFRYNLAKKRKVDMKKYLILALCRNLLV